MKKLASIIGIAVCVVLIQFAPVATAQASGNGSWHCDNEPLVSFWEGFIAGNELSGRGTVCATPLGLWSSMRVHGLTPGNAYTVWWVYIDDPDSCAGPFPPGVLPLPEPEDYAGPCGFADFFTPDESGLFLNPLVVYGRMDSVVAGNRRYTRFGGDVRSFEPSSGSQVWLFIFGHGPADSTDKRQLARQLLTPEDPGSGAPHLGIEGRPFGYPAGVVVIEIP